MSRVNWTRPPGPPNVWKIIDVEEKIYNAAASRVRLSIQDIPENRYEEALDHMCKYFLVDEFMCKCLRVKDNPDGVNDSRLIWSYLLKQGMSIGAYKLIANGELGELVGMNVLFVPTSENLKKIDEIIMNFKSTEAKMIFTVLNDASGKVDICKIYGVDKYLTAMGLSVKPIYRGQKLGLHLLEVRKNIGKKYGIPATSTLFMGPSSQIQAERAGFETLLTMKYAEILNENGQPAFPNIAAEVFKMMARLL